MEINTVIKFNITINYTDCDLSTYINRCRKEITKHMAMYDKIYSYNVKAVYMNNRFSAITINYMIAETEKYNTIDVLAAIGSICLALANIPLVCETNLYITYGQPPLDLLIELYEPLVLKLTRKQYLHWKRYMSYEDIKQTCYLVICELYQEGYYIHKRLVERAYNNRILHCVAEHNNAPNIVLLDKLEDIYGNDKHDVLQDESAEQELLDVEQPQRELIKERKQAVLAIISERQYDMLVSEYTNHMTSSSSNRLVYQIKQKISKQNKGEDK